MEIVEVDDDGHVIADENSSPQDVITDESEISPNPPVENMLLDAAESHKVPHSHMACLSESKSIYCLFVCSCRRRGMNL